MLGPNPFTDQPEARTAGEPVTPRIRITEITATNVTLAIELVDAGGWPVVTLNRACLRVGDTLSIKDISINLQVEIKS